MGRALMAEQIKKKSWQVPAYGSPKDVVQTWVKEQVQDGIQYFETSPAYQQLQESIRILSGLPTDKLSQKQTQMGYSQLHTNRLKRNIREMVNALADIHFTPGYYSDANEYQSVAGTVNRVAASWYADRFIDVKIKRAIQWMAITPSCYMELMYRRMPGERDRCEIDLIPHSCFDVVETGISESKDTQESYTVTIIKDLPVYLAHSIWPEFQDDLTPDRETPQGWKEKAIAVVKDVFSSGEEVKTAKNPTVRLYYTYVLDLAINKSGDTKKMGYDKGQETAWSYDVPSVGQMIKAGYDKDGVEVFRKADAKDCRLFPGRRLIVCTETKCIYDGPMWDMHGKVPLVKMSSDSWPFADFSMIHDVANVQDAINEMERMIHQTSRNKLNPSILYNMRALARDKAKAFRTEVTGQRIGYNGNEGTDPVKPALPASFYEIEGWQSEFIEYLNTNGLDYQMGVNAFSAMAKAKVGAGGDAMEKLLELAGPIVKGISRDMERAFRDIADMFIFLVFQYYTTAKIMTIVGVDGVTPETFDFDPGKIIPSHMPGEMVDDPNGGKSAPPRPSMYPTRERAKFLAEHIRFFITPNTLHEITQSAQKMMYLQLWRGGFPIDSWTLAEVFNIGNFGKKPEGTDDIMSRWIAEQKMKAELAAQMQQFTQDLQGGAEAGGNTPKLGPNGGQKGTGGRPASGGAPPK
jgi:hypothetical protein